MGILSKKCLGIDIGASSIKLVEISSFGRKKKLENYVEFQLPLDTALAKTFYGENLLLLSNEVSDILQAILKKAKIKQREVIFSIPDFSTLFTTFSLPPMTETEVPQAIEFEARHHIPVPLSEVTFDWQIIEKQEVSPGVKLKVLLVAVPNKVLERYQRMATLCQFKVKGMEVEVFSLIRSSIPKDKYQKPVCLIDFGWQSTIVSIAEKGSLRVSHTFDVSSTGLAKALSATLSVDLQEAENLKKEYGLDPKREDISRVLREEINSLALAIEKVCQDFYQAETKQVEDIILAGGTASLFGLKEYLSSRLKKNVQIVEPFSSLSFPPILKDRLKALGPSFAIAVGLAMMGAES